MKKVAWILLIVGGLNWGLYGAINLDVVAFLPDLVARIVYILVGLSAVVMLFKGGCKSCDSHEGGSAPMSSGNEASMGGDSQM